MMIFLDRNREDLRLNPEAFIKAPQPKTVAYLFGRLAEFFHRTSPNRASAAAFFHRIDEAARDWRPASA